MPDRLTAIPDRLAKLDSVDLGFGSHEPDDGKCAMEAVAWLAGEKHSDAPECACPVIAAFVRALNDGMPDDATRNKYLRPLLPRLIGTRSTLKVQIRRGYLAADAAARILAPMALDAVWLKDEAAKLRALSPVVDRKTALAAEKVAAWAARAESAAWAARAESAARADLYSESVVLIERMIEVRDA